MKTFKKTRIKKGDKVKILLGKDRGKDGAVEKVSAKEGKVWILGHNVYKRHVKKNSQLNIEGGVIEIIKPLNISNVGLLCPNCGKLTRVGFSVTKGDKFRVCKKCGKPIDSAVKKTT